MGHPTINAEFINWFVPSKLTYLKLALYLGVGYGGSVRSRIPYSSPYDSGGRNKGNTNYNQR